MHPPILAFEVTTRSRRPSSETTPRFDGHGIPSRYFLDKDLLSCVVAPDELMATSHLLADVNTWKENQVEALCSLLSLIQRAWPRCAALERLVIGGSCECIAHDRAPTH
jgi:hypothetical protein